MTQYHGSRPYKPYPIPTEAKDIPRYLSAELDRLANVLADIGKVAWGGAHVPGKCYDKNTMVNDGGHTWIANKDTCDAPGAPSVDWDSVGAP